MKKIIWAIDPFNMDPKVAKLYFPLLKSLCGPDDVIHPTYVASRLEFKVVAAFDIPEARRFLNYPRETLERFLDKAGLKSIKANALCEWCDSMSTGEVARTFNKISSRVGAELVVAFSQNKSTYQRFFIGSFAETLLSFIAQPLLLLRPGRPIKKLKTAMFCSDLEENEILEASEFQYFIDILNLKGGVFFHAAAPFYKNDFGNPPEEIVDYRKATDVKLKNLVAHFKGKKVSVLFDGGLSTVADLIEKHAKKSKVDFLITRGKSGPAKGLLLGSVKRQLLRKSSLPVLYLPCKK